MSDAYRLRWDDADWRSGLTLVRERDGAEIAYDYGEPEDRTFGRDFAPVVQELNAVAASLAASESERRALLALLRMARVVCDDLAACGGLVQTANEDALRRALDILDAASPSAQEAPAASPATERTATPTCRFRCDPAGGFTNSTCPGCGRFHCNRLAEHPCLNPGVTIDLRTGGVLPPLSLLGSTREMREREQVRRRVRERAAATTAPSVPVTQTEVAILTDPAPSPSRETRGAPSPVDSGALGAGDGGKDGNEGGGA